ncbi:MAG: L-serine ammonia-lyase, iron-sulfur-dependent, subunit alpha [Termitinemataceae bacterium]|nr:MAG: L-serine ammonia-lyase, iron-sulfur-dependent, subunit alpha [Termitinemataceae bacterium]
MNYHSISEIAAEANAAGKRISDVVIADQAASMDISCRDVFAKMKHNLDVMKQSALTGESEKIRSQSGLTGGAGYLMTHYAKSGDALCGSFCAAAIARAVSIAECNAAMGKIVAAPTAGSCGILPAAVLTMMESRGASVDGNSDQGANEESAVMALITAGAFGLVIANEASISGAEGGCQAECGSAAGIAAAALVEMAGGCPDQCAHACAIALKNQLGLVCDPVAGLVEVPCVKRNAGGVMCAICAADMALAGMKSVIPVDEVIEAMRCIGDSMPKELRETACGGLAVTPTAQLITQKIFGGLNPTARIK